MPNVSTVIKQTLRQKEEGIKTGAQAMRDVMRNLHSQVMTELGRAALGSWDAYHLKQVLASIEEQMAASESSAVRSLEGDADTMWEAGCDLVDKPLAAGGIYTGFRVSTSSLAVLKEYSSTYLKRLFGDAWYGVKAELSLGILGTKTPQEVTTSIGRTLRSGLFKNYAHRAETITKVEMGRIYSAAAQKRMEEASRNVSGLEKQWNHGGHPRKPRPSHVAAHGQHVPVNDPFLVGGVSMMYPRDPEAPVSETIGCGCDHVPYMESWQ
jgi:hypothetical protein